MARNARRPPNTLSHRWVRYGFLVCVGISVLGICYGIFTFRTFQLAEEIRSLEEELARLEERNKALAFTVEQRRAPRQLQEKIHFYRLGLVPISSGGMRIVEVTPPSVVRRYEIANRDVQP